MANQWFRMYSEFADDPKVQMLPEHMQRRLVMLFCDRSSDVLGTSQERHIAFHWRISDGELQETKALFIAQGFINDGWEVLNWNARQFVSDSSTSRTQRYRERRRTSQERHSDADVTKCDALEQNRTEQNRAEQTHKQPLARSAKKPALQANILSPDQVAGTLPLVDGTEYHVSKDQVAEWRGAFPAVDVLQELREMKVWIAANPTKRKTRRGIAKAIVSWMSREQDKPHTGDRYGSTQNNQAPRLSPASQRGIDSRARIAAAGQRRYGSSVATDAGAGAGSEAESGATGGNPGYVPDGLGAAGIEAWSAGVQGSVIDGATREQVLSRT